MKKILIVIFVLAALLEGQAQNEETRNLPSFNKISVGQSIKLVIEEGNENTARIETTGVDTDKVLTEVSGSGLNIHMENGSYRSTTVKVYLTYKSNLEAIKASSSSSVTGKSVIKSNEMSVKVSSSAFADLSVDAKELDIDVSSSARASLEVNAQDLDVEVTSSGRLELTGRTSFQRFHISSSGKFMAYGLQSERVKADISSSGSAEISVSDELIADASSSGRISYKGNPEKVIVDASSSGKVRKAN